LWRENKVDAICTAPISKKALALVATTIPVIPNFSLI
jgi:hypothetical protein